METLRNAFKKEDNLRIIKKEEYDIYYSCTHKFPLLTVEHINENTGKTIGQGFKRNDPVVKNPWKADMSLPKNCRHNVKNYREYMEYGGSNGHNAPASYHKTNLDIYLSTFKLSNHCPQETVFNGSLWVLLEVWCKNLQREKNLQNITVYTGSIPDTKTQTFYNTVMNVPTHMFKVVTAKDKNEPHTLYIACFLMENKIPRDKIHKLYKHLISLKDLSKKTNINFFQMFQNYSNFNPRRDSIHGLKQKVIIDLHFKDNRGLIRQMYSAHWFGQLIYSKTIEELEEKWNETKRRGFDDEYHEMYYKFAKKRIKREPNAKLPTMVNFNSPGDKQYDKTKKAKHNRSSKKSLKKG